MSDAYNYLRFVDNGWEQQKQLQQNTGEAITDQVQLLMVLPPYSKHLLDDSLQMILDDIEYGCAHYYPIKFCLTSYLKSQLWECSPVIPNVDVDVIQRAYEKVRTK